MRCNTAVAGTLSWHTEWKIPMYFHSKIVPRYSFSCDIFALYGYVVHLLCMLQISKPLMIGLAR